MYLNILLCPNSCHQHHHEHMYSTPTELRLGRGDSLSKHVEFLTWCIFIFLSFLRYIEISFFLCDASTLNHYEHVLLFLLLRFYILKLYIYIPLYKAHNSEHVLKLCHTFSHIQINLMQLLRWRLQPSFLYMYHTCV